MKVFLMISLGTAVISSTIHAKPSFVSRIPNGANVPNVPAVGHLDRTGTNSARDAFGKAFEKADKKWTKTLCQADSDGDGQTNGHELGDPCCVWVAGATPRFTVGVSNPGDAASKRYNTNTNDSNAHHAIAYHPDTNYACTDNPDPDNANADYPSSNDAGANNPGAYTGDARPNHPNSNNSNPNNPNTNDTEAHNPDPDNANADYPSSNDAGANNPGAYNPGANNAYTDDARPNYSNSNNPNTNNSNPNNAGASNATVDDACANDG